MPFVFPHFIIAAIPHLKREARNFIKKETLAQVLFCEFCDIFKNTFFTEHLRTTASVIGKKDFIDYINMDFES